MKDVEFQTAEVKKCFYVFGQTNHRAIARLDVVCMCVCCLWNMMQEVYCYFYSG